MQYLVNLEARELNYNISSETDADKLFSSPCKFVLGSTDFAHFPKTDIPEIAFIGRSNVGKSSLLNALVKQKALARVSVTPGRTQQVNFFSLNDKLLLVDLPGYGFAKAPKNLVKAWERMSLGYLKNSVQLKKLFLLIDSRHGFKPSDFEFIASLVKNAIHFQVILTKIDKANKSEIEQTLKTAREVIQSAASMFPDVILASAKESRGILQLRNYIYNYI
jgi:GTP-binding protein